jgi:hypothetical protein
MGELLNTNEIGELIRKWVYYDNLIQTFNKQLQNARKVRNTLETTVITKLQESKMENAIIQIGGGRLTVVDEKHGSPLSFKTLEANLHEYYLKKGGSDETAGIIAFLRKKRIDDMNVTKTLKRS